MILNNLGTKYCLKCGKPTTIFAGHLKAKMKMALGNLVEVKVGAGWCSIECHDLMKSDKDGCYGIYDNSMELINVFK
jgi:VIT1/CCC1 family predicted Fe2+/Mn2+ transporter